MNSSAFRFWAFGFCIFVAVVYCDVSSSQEPEADNQPTDSDSILELLVPPELPPVRLGDPIYVPLAVCNPANEAIDAPLFRHHNPDFAYDVRSGNEQVTCDDYGQAFGRGEFHMLQARSVETTVIMINIWTPGIGLQFLKTGKASIDFTAYVSSQPNLPAISATTVIELVNADSPFFVDKSAVNRDVIEIARNVFTPAFREESFGNRLNAGRPLTTAFNNGQSPLYWLDFKGNRVESWHADSKFYKEAKALVYSDSSLHRMMSFIELRNELRGVNAERARTSREVLDAYFELLNKCHPSERHYNIVALNSIWDVTAFPDAQRQPDMTWAELSAEIVQRLPMYRMYFDPDFRANAYSTISLLGHSGL